MLLDMKRYQAPLATWQPLVLIVDSHHDSREVCSLYSTPKGFLVAEADNGPSAIERARAFRPDAIVTDIVLRGIDGWDVIGALRDDPLTRNTPLVVLTGFLDAATKAKALDRQCAF